MHNYIQYKHATNSNHYNRAVSIAKERAQGKWLGCYDAVDKFLPILNKAKVDLVVSGHTHRFAYHEPEAVNNSFPQLVQGHPCATRLDIKDGKIAIKVMDTAGKLILEKELK